MSDDAPYCDLFPETVLDAIEALGVRCDGRVLALNSYENRVYQIGLEDAEPLIAKFYRPDRWSDAAILEEHAFAQELAAQEIPVIAPLGAPGQSLHVHDGYRLCGVPAPRRPLAGVGHPRRPGVGGGAFSDAFMPSAARVRSTPGARSMPSSWAATPVTMCWTATGCRLPGGQVRGGHR